MSDGQDWGAKRAAAYDKRIREIFPVYEELHRHALAILKRTLPSSDILVVGAGTGYEVLAYSTEGYRVTAIDPSEEMLAVGRERATPSDSIEFVQGSLNQFPVLRRYEAVTSMLVMHFLPDDGSKAEFLFSCAMQCRQGGTLILADLVGEPGTQEFDREFQEWERAIARNSTAHQAERDLAAIKRDVHFISVSRLQTLMAEAGWTNLTLEWQSGLLNLWSATRT